MSIEGEVLNVELDILEHRRYRDIARSGIAVAVVVPSFSRIFPDRHGRSTASLPR